MLGHFSATWIIAKMNCAKFHPQWETKIKCTIWNCWVWAVTSLPYQHRISSRDLRLEKQLKILGTERKRSSRSQVASFSEWWDHCTFMNLTVLLRVLRSEVSRTQIVRSGYERSGLSWMQSKQLHAQAAWNIASSETHGTHRAPSIDSPEAQAERREVL